MQEKVLQEVPEGISIFNYDILFGEHSHMFNYLIECVKSGQIPQQILDSQFKFSPLSMNDAGFKLLIRCEAFGSRDSKSFWLWGPEEMTLKDLVNKIEQSLGKDANSTRGYNVPLSFDHSYEQNLIQMVNYFETNQQLLGEMRKNNFLEAIASKNEKVVQTWLNEEMQSQEETLQLEEYRNKTKEFLTY